MKDAGLMESAMDKINKNDKRLFIKPKTDEINTQNIQKLLQNKTVNPNRKVDESNLKGLQS